MHHGTQPWSVFDKTNTYYTCAIKFAKDKLLLFKIIYFH